MSLCYPRINCLERDAFSLFELSIYCTYTFLLQVQIEAVAEATVLAHP